ncbi:RICIN domain-containing protein [Streptomyces roseifaciens]
MYESAAIHYDQGVFAEFIGNFSRGSGMKRSAKLAAIFASAAAVIVMAPGVSYAEDPVEISSGGKCLEIDGSSSRNGARAQIWDCNGQSGSQWYMQWWSNGYYRLVNGASGKCLEVADSRTDNGAPVQQWDCAGNATQYWKAEYVSGRGTVFKNVNSGKVLEVENGSRSNGARVQQWNWGNAPGQAWAIVNS